MVRLSLQWAGTTGVQLAQQFDDGSAGMAENQLWHALQHIDQTTGSAASTGLDLERI